MLTQIATCWSAALPRCVALACFALLAAISGGYATAQSDDYELTPELERKASDPQNFDGGIINDQNFNAWVFGNAQPMTLKTEPPQLAVMLAELERLCSITPEQKQKLELAAKMDLRIFLNDVETARTEFLQFKSQQEMFNEFYNSVIRPLAVRRSGGFLGKGSLFAKVVKKTLTKEQLAAYDAAQEERRKFQYRSAIDAALLSLGDASGLTAKQHEAIADFLLANTPPPLIPGRQDRQYVYYQLSQISQTKLLEVIPQKEADKFKKLVAPYAGMKQSLISIGMIAPP